MCILPTSHKPHHIVYSCSMNQKQVLFSTLAVLVLFAGLFGVYKLIGAGPDEALITKVKSGKPAERTMWNKNGAHTLAVFSDFQCPACKVFHEFLSGLEASTSPSLNVTKNTSFVFRYYPLYQIHKQAFPLAYAAEAAAKQNKFEEVSKRFFADQTSFESMTDLNKYLTGVAKDLGLDSKKFFADMNDKTLQSIIQNDLSLGESLGVNATPTFYLDGEKLESMPPENLLKILKDLK